MQEKTMTILRAPYHVLAIVEAFVEKKAAVAQ